MREAGSKVCDILGRKMAEKIHHPLEMTPAQVVLNVRAARRGNGISTTGSSVATVSEKRRIAEALLGAELSVASRLLDVPHSTSRALLAGEL